MGHDPSADDSDALILPLSPVSMSDPSELAMSSSETLSSDPSRKLLIQVPVKSDYITPPPSADIHVPSRRQSLLTSPMVSKRASAPVHSWSARNFGKEKDPADSNGPISPLIPPPSSPAPTAPLPAVPESPMTVVQQEPTPPSSSRSDSAEDVVQKGEQGNSDDRPPISSSSSAIYLPSLTKSHTVSATSVALPAKPSSSTPSTSLAPPSAYKQRQRRKSAPQQPAAKSPPLRVRNSPSYVSLIDFESSEDEDDVNTYDGSLKQESDELSSQEAQEKLVPDADLAQWAPEPAFVPVHIPISAVASEYARNLSNHSQSSRRGPQSPPRSYPASHRSHSSIRSSDREGSLAGMTRRTNSSGSGLVSNRSAPSLPPAIKHHALLGLSALPNELVQKDVDYTLRAMMSPTAFARMLMEPLARHRFREFLIRDGGDGAKELDLWTDTRYLGHAMEDLRNVGQVFRDMYISSTSNNDLLLPPETKRELRAVLQQVLAADAGLGRTQSQLLESMYNDGFQRFIKHQIIQEAHVALGRANLNLAGAQAGEGLGDTFVLTNPRLPDHPIVLVSDGFVAITGYPRSQIIGRNCRFLQGPGTPPASVQRIRDGLNSGKGCTELLLNYRRDGEPFYCLLCIIPVRDASGAIVYFIGGQTNVTGLLATEKGLGLGLGGVSSTDASKPLPPVDMSPAMAALCNPSDQAPEPTVPAISGAAGAVLGGSLDKGPRIGSGFLKGLFGKQGASGTRLEGVSSSKQVIAGAEATLNGPGESKFQDQYAIFQHTYSKIMIFKLKKREITFVSPQMLAFLGLPTRNQREELASPLIRSDMATLITGGEDRNETRKLREELKDAVRRGVPCSMSCGVTIPGKSILARNENRARFGMMHMTPIKDGDNVAVAFVVIFG
ncbi:hypothetical protein MIND_00820900 [Mycena indigotica]|uniref:LOV domain-containing protein n=1 Tax=Mycena indigotica TaxID=2126181 RepID=A0A8H6W496_9AGAR|nr:uncharacterized protein MIND_00820900 [Mycena indigotica]KAF7298734.1 hypothetical protein MIND_00820900 [Mycena indigotica]